AEDGIRDLIVTGVQTCALPIYRALERDDAAAARLDTHVAEHLLVRGLALARGEHYAHARRGAALEERHIAERHTEALEHRTGARDRKSTRLNSSHDQISYAVFC